MELQSGRLLELREELNEINKSQIFPAERVKEILSEIQHISELNLNRYEEEAVPEEFLEKYKNSYKLNNHWSNALYKLIELQKKIPSGNKLEVNSDGAAAIITVTSSFISYEESQVLNTSIYNLIKDYLAASNEYSRPTFIMAQIIQSIVFKQLKDVLYQIKMVAVDGVANSASMAFVESLMPEDQIKAFYFREVAGEIAQSGQAEGGIVGESLEVMLTRLFS